MIFEEPWDARKQKFLNKLYLEDPSLAERFSKYKEKKRELLVAKESHRTIILEDLLKEVDTYDLDPEIGKIILSGWYFYLTAQRKAGEGPYGFKLTKDPMRALGIESMNDFVNYFLKYVKTVDEFHLEDFRHNFIQESTKNLGKMSPFEIVSIQSFTYKIGMELSNEKPMGEYRERYFYREQFLRLMRENKVVSEEAENLFIPYILRNMRDYIGGDKIDDLIEIKKTIDLFSNEEIEKELTKLFEFEAGNSKEIFKRYRKSITKEFDRAFCKSIFMRIIGWNHLDPIDKEELGIVLDDLGLKNWEIVLDSIPDHMEIQDENLYGDFPFTKPSRNYLFDKLSLRSRQTTLRKRISEGKKPRKDKNRGVNYVDSFDFDNRYTLFLLELYQRRKGDLINDL
jgi:hypothetical protein